MDIWFQAMAGKMKNILASAYQIKNGEDIDFGAHPVSINLKELSCTLISPFYSVKFFFAFVKESLIAYLIFGRNYFHSCGQRYVGDGGCQRCVEERRGVWRRVGIVDCYFNIFFKQILTVELEK